MPTKDPKPSMITDKTPDLKKHTDDQCDCCCEEDCSTPDMKDGVHTCHCGDGECGHCHCQHEE